MPGKRNPFTFTLMFNPTDPHHKKAVEIINQQGRRKSQFIAAAILHYIDCNRIPASSLLQDQQMEQLIDQIVIKILSMRDHNQPHAPYAKTPPPKKAPYRPDDVEEFYEEDSPLSNEDEELLLRGLDSFTQNN